MATKLDLTVEQGATFRQRLTWQDSTGQPINLTGFTARMQAREKAASTTARVNLTTSNGGITLGGANGTIDLYISATDTAAFTWYESVYDLELVNGSEVTRLIAGKLFCTKEVTR